MTSTQHLGKLFPVNKIPTPQELGLQEKYQSWRPSQEEAIRILLASKLRASAASLPTGSGKTGIVLAYAILSKKWFAKNTCIVTASRGLQDQYMREGAGLGLVDLRGRNNYTCQMRPDLSCEEGRASKCLYTGSVSCPSCAAEMKAAASAIVVTNYDKWCHSKRFGNGMDHFDQVVFDEGHEAPEALSRTLQTTLSDHEISEIMKLKPPSITDAEEFPNWRVWAVKARSVAEMMMLEARNRLVGVRDPKPSWIKHFMHMRNLTRRLVMLSTANQREWVVEVLDNGNAYQFDPVSPGRYSESTLLLGVPRIVVISATLRHKTMFMCGLGKNSFDFTEFDSDFDPKRCPIYYIPRLRVDARTGDLSPLWLLLDQILSRRLDRKGIIQTISFDRQKAVAENSRFRDHMIRNPKGEAPTKIIEKYLKSGPGTFLSSPSVGMGYDFPDDDCRFQFICKIPFDPPSKVLKARVERDKDYRGYRATQKLVQMFGRHIRSRQDWGEAFIADMHMDWFWPANRHFAPRSFHGFLQQVDIVPQPLYLS